RAFDSVFRTHYAHLVRMAESMLRDRALAEEVVQDVMLELWRRRESLEVEQTFAAYLIRSTRNRALNHIRHQRVVAREAAAAAVESQASPSAEEELLGVELQHAVRDAIEALPEKSREVFRLSREHGLKYAEVTSVQELAVHTVGRRRRQAVSAVTVRLAAVA